MPPSFKFTKQQIIEAGVEIIRENGIESITARSIAHKLQSSPRVIFSHFNTMDELLSSIKQEIKENYAEKIRNVLQHSDIFRSVGATYIQFAIQEPKFFQLLFMTEQESHPSIQLVLPIITDYYTEILQSIILTYNLPVTVAERIYQHMWIYCHGIATLYVTKTCSFTPDEVSEMVSEVFLSILRRETAHDQD